MDHLTGLKEKMGQLESIKEELTQQNNQFKAALYQVPVGVMISSVVENKILIINPELEKIVGLSQKELVGHQFSKRFTAKGGKIYYTGDSATKQDSFSQHFLSSKHLIAKDFELLLSRPDGKEIYTSMSSSPVLDAAGNTIAVISILCDVTARKKEEDFYRNAKVQLEKEVELQTKNLKETNDQLQTIFNASSESIWVCNGEGKVIRVNCATEKLFGIGASEVEGKNISELVERGFMDRSVTGMVLQSGEQTSIIQNALKTKKQLLVTGSPVFDEKGNITMVIVNERDLTQLNILQKELQQVKEVTSRFKEELVELQLQELAAKDIISQSPQMQEILTVGIKLASMDISNILILGESGTGKGLLAKFIHNSSKKANGPFVKINCAALPESLLEAELFGYEKGAFTGARDKGKMGLFEMAENGTLFLDEIGELPLSLQAKLLHCLEENEIMHLGGLTPIKVNCKVIAATNVDLEERVEKKTFRKDLFFRLNTFPITIPPLRERPEDILELSLYFLEKYNDRYESERRISSSELKKIQSHPFPGNVRELKNIIKKAVVLSYTSIEDSLGGTSIIDASGRKSMKVDPDINGKSFKEALAEYERSVLAEALKKHPTTRSLASHLSMSQSQVVRKLAEHNLTGHLKRKKGKV